MAERTVIIGSAAIAALGGFAPLPNAIAARADLSFGAKVAYAKLLAYGWEKDFAAPAQERLAHDLGLGHDRHVRRLLTELRAVGLLSWQRRGQGRPNLYVVHLPDKCAGQDRTDMAGQNGDDRPDVSGLDRPNSSAPSIQEKKKRDKKTLALFPEPQDKGAGSSPRRRGASKGGDAGVKPLTWLQELNEDHRAKCGGDFANWAAAGDALKPLHAELGAAELRRRWQYYLAKTEIQFVSPKQFATKRNAFIPPATWQPGTPVSSTGTPQVAHPDAVPEGGDRYAAAEARQREQESRSGLR